MTLPRRPKAGLAAIALLMLLSLRAQGLPLLLPGCPWRALTGVPCPTCFLTRSALATLQGDLGEALELHLFGPPLVLSLGWLGWRQGLLGRPLRFGRRRWQAAAAVAAALLIYWLMRLFRWRLAGVPLPG
ncbi:DUF2752 domain-containing protein [Synechococcus sp. HK01-R]|uniref:DUF2752 domain-containing protein n=1 Tax=Synechococcus sp. HK01-R TaxID=2751171 RepID=UPI001625C616|nr:DUF2752 domain-containing protein [Synechococcus sp. HK01-R]QNG26892.1 DUF2752 domain-containing protein [Synechococcus sp. HK01-R]